MEEIEKNDNYRFGKLLKFSKEKVSLAQILFIKVAIYLENQEDPDSIESMRKLYLIWVDVKNTWNIAKYIVEQRTKSNTPIPTPDFMKKFEKLIPLMEKMPEQVRLKVFAGFLYQTYIENPEMAESFMSNENIVLKVFGKSFSQIRTEFLDDPFAKPIFLRLEKDLQSEDPIRRIIASYPSLQDISNMARALPDELGNEPIPEQAKKQYVNRRLRLLRTNPKEFLDWVKDTYIIPKPKITFEDENKKASIEIGNEEFSLSIKLSPALMGIELLCEYWGYDNGQMLYDFEHRVSDFNTSLLYKMLAEDHDDKNKPKLGQSENSQELTKQMSLRIPIKPKTLTKWREIWKKIQTQYRQNKSYKEIEIWLSSMHGDLSVSAETIADICKAGVAGRLDQP